ncbi:probable disease resistance protein RF45 [Andrographis paniculata]|uniref:probable disease resistance protein RF45 n=1 Tax=Andrographis paniculata TaxID=175694 RepID=UPI0021E7E31A|nr:probable disease resistance protein RF45 [Andrographis paniculata]
MAAEAAVTFLLENVTQLLKSYVDLIAGAETELELLKSDLSLLKGFLVEAGKKQHKEEPFRALERQIREVVYDAEDTIDTCLAAAATAAASSRPKFVRAITSSRSLNLAKEVKTLRLSKVKPMFDKAKVDFVKMQIGDGSAAEVFASPRAPGKIQLIRQDNVVGFEDEEATIKGYLKKETEELDVVSIIGMPGLGKTTLAWKIFHDKAIKYEFPTRIWIYVSQDFNRRDVLLKILKGYTDLDMSGNTDLDLAQAVRTYLEQGKFLLVMDDVWDVQAWNDIKPVLPKERKNSKVLITSRTKNVGTHANPSRNPHNLRFLTEDESWDLLQYEVFGKLNCCPDELKGIGRLIAKQCDGLPLALVVIGGILVDYTSQEMSAIQNAWNKVSDNVSNYVKNYDKEDRIAKIVALSYKKLSEELKNCFLYLGMFPEDHEISAWTLTRLWIAEGFVQHKDGESLEETAEGILNDLINRNLVMAEKMNSVGGVKTCRVHDVIREFCNSKAGFDDLNLFQEIKMSKEGVFDPPVSDLAKYRRLCIHFHIPKFLAQKQLKGPKVRSFLCCNKAPFLLEPQYITKIPEAFNLLRVLESKSFKFNTFPARVPKLIHLRYVTLSFENVDIIPDSIADLWNLQTLLIDTKSRTLEIRANLWKLMQLRHLKTKAAILLTARSYADQACENLQTLTHLSPEFCTTEVFKRVRNVKRLGIRGKLTTLLEGNYSLGTLDRLENLKLVNDLAYGAASENPMPALPQPSFFPVGLKRLTLSATYLDWRCMPTLGKIVSLQVLKLKDNAFTGRLWDAEGHGFRGLHFLLIANSDLVFWRASAGDFPVLRSLVIKNCEKLAEIPEVIEDSLKKLSLDVVGKSAVERAKKIKEAKQPMHGQQQARWSGFELKLGPGCE